MSMPYEPIASPCYIIDNTKGFEIIRLNPKRNYFILAFMLFWLGAWTVGGATALTGLARHFNWFIFFWLGAWCAGELAVASALAWAFAGSESLRIIGQDLEISYKLFGFRKTRLYRGQNILNLAVAPQPLYGQNRAFQMPLLSNKNGGAIMFAYGARSTYFGFGLDPAEAQMVIERLRDRLHLKSSHTAVSP